MIEPVPAPPPHAEASAVPALPYFEHTSETSFIVRPLAIVGMAIGTLRCVGLLGSYYVSMVRSDYSAYPDGWRRIFAIGTDGVTGIAALVLIISAFGCVRLQPRARRSFAAAAAALAALALLQIPLYFAEILSADYGFYAGWPIHHRVAILVSGSAWVLLSGLLPALLSYFMTRSQVLHAFGGP